MMLLVGAFFTISAIAGLSHPLHAPDRCNKAGHISLTFDSPDFLNDEILRVLRENNAKATFHIPVTATNDVIKEMVEKAMADEHLIAMTLAPSLPAEEFQDLHDAEIRSQLVDLSEAFQSDYGVFPRYIRLPAGYLNARISRQLMHLGFIPTHSTLELPLGSQGAGPYEIANTYSMMLTPKDDDGAADVMIGHREWSQQSAQALDIAIKAGAKTGHMFVDLATCTGHKLVYKSDPWARHRFTDIRHQAPKRRNRYHVDAPSREHL